MAWGFARHSTLPHVGDLAFLSELAGSFGRADPVQALKNLEAALPGWFWALAALVGMGGMGRRLAGWLRLPLPNAALSAAFAFGLGILLYNALWLGLGLNALWFRPLFVGFILGGLVLGIGESARVGLPRLPRGLPFWAWGPALLALLVLLLALAQSLVPEVYFDGLVYHLSVPRFWLDRHALLNDPACFHSYYPFGAELYFLNGFFNGDPTGAKALNTVSLVLAALAAGGWAAESAGAAWGLLTGASLFFLPWASTTVWGSQNEAVLGLFLLLFFYSALRWVRAPRQAARPWAWAVGLLGGAAFAVKYTALPAFAALLPSLWLQDRRVFTRERWGDWARMCLLWTASLGPWLLKNWVYTGNPLYPYFPGIFGGLRLPAGRYAELLGNHESAFGTGMPFWKWPWEAARHLMDPSLAPPLFCFLPLLFLGAAFWKKERALLALAALYLAFGFLVSFQTRLMLPEMFLFLTAAGIFLGNWKDPFPARVWSAALGLFGLLTLLSLARLSVDYFGAQKVWWGGEDRGAYLASCPQTSSYYPLAQACGALPPGDRLLIMGDARALYYPRPFVVNSVYDDPAWVDIARTSPDEAAVGEALRRLGVDDLVLSAREEARMAALYPADYALTPRQRRVWEGFLAHRTDEVIRLGASAVYRLKPGASDPRPIGHPAS